MHLRGRISKQI